MQKGSKLSEQAKKKISEAKKGKKYGPISEERREKIRAATLGKKKTIVAPNPGWFPKGNIPWIKGKSLPSPLKGIKKDPEVVEKVASQLRGRKISPEIAERLRKHLAYYRSLRPISEGRRSNKSRKWSLAVRERDNNTCQKCGSKEKLHAHHIIPWKNSPNLRFDLSNGITYCNKCHKSIEQTGKASPMKGKKIPEKHRLALCKPKNRKILLNEKS